MAVGLTLFLALALSAHPAAASSVTVPGCGTRSVTKSTATPALLGGFQYLRGAPGVAAIDYEDPKMLALFGLKPHKETPFTRQGLEAIYNDGLAYFQRADFKAASAEWNRGIFQAEKISDDSMLAFFHNGIGDAEYRLGHRENALSDYAQGLALAKKIGDRRETLHSLINAGEVLLDRDDYGKALKSCSEGLSLVGDDKESRARLLIGAGRARYGLGDGQAALDDYYSAIVLYEELGDKKGEALARIRQGIVFASRGQRDMAVGTFDEASRLQGWTGREHALAEQEMGLALLDMGEPDSALRYLQDRNDPFYMARYHLATGKLKEAEAEFRKEIGREHKTDSSGELAGNLIGLGLSLERQGRRDAARRAFEEAAALLERKREKLPVSNRTGFFSERESNFPRLEAYKGRSRTSADPVDGLYWSESAKARAFAEALAHGSENNPGKIPEDLALEESTFGDELAQLLRDQDGSNTTSGAPQEIRGMIDCARQFQGAFVAKLRRGYPTYAAARYPQPLKALEIKLRPDEVVFEYDVGEAESRLYVLASDRKIAAYQIRIPIDELRALIDSFRKPFDNPLDADGRFAGRFDAAAGKRLYDLLIKPALVFLRKSAKVVIVPDGPLGLIPFEALPISTASARYLGDVSDVAYAQSATALTLARALREGPAASAGMLVLADPIFSRSDPRAKGAGLDG